MTTRLPVPRLPFNSRARALLRITLALASVPLIVIGGAMMLSGEAAARIAEVLSSAALELTPAYRHALAITGAYIVVFGLLMAAAARDPWPRGIVIDVAIALFAARALQRVFFADTLQAAYGVDATKNALNVGYLGGVAVTLAVLRIASGRQAGGAGGRERTAVSGGGRAVALRAILVFVCAAHLAIGGTLIFGGEGAVILVARSYGVSEPSRTAQFLYIVKPLGVYMLAFGVMAAWAAHDPRGHRPVIYGLAGVLILLALQRSLAVL